MTTALLTISILGNLFAVIFVIGARQAAKEGVVDTMRLNGLIEHRFALAVDEAEWGVIHKGTLVASGADLRAVLDEADNKVADHG